MYKITFIPFENIKSFDQENIQIPLFNNISTINILKKKTFNKWIRFLLI
jgi:hypothetical protein